MVKVTKKAVKKVVKKVVKKAVKKVVKKAVKKSNPIQAEKKALKLVGKGLGEKHKGIIDICDKYNIGKTFVNDVIKVRELEIKQEKKEKENNILEKQKVEAKEKKEVEAKEKKERQEKNRIEIKEKKLKESQEKKEREEANKEEKRIAKEQVKNIKEQEQEVAKELKKLKIEELESNWKDCPDSLFIDIMNDDPKKAQHYFTQRLMHEYHFKVMDDNEDILIYCEKGDNKGKHLEDGDKFIETECEKRLGEKAIIFAVREIISKIQRTEKLKIKRESIFEQPKDIIAVKDGILNMKTGKLEEFTPDRVFLSKVNANYNPEAKPKMWLDFLNSSLPDNESQIKVIQEFSGYTLSNDNSRQKALLSLGAGATGQSTMQDIIGGLIGEENITHLSIQEMEQDAFATSQLFGKKANMNPDLPKKALGESSRVKKIIRGEKIFVQKKGKDGYNMRPMSKLWNGVNQMPRTSDLSDGFFRSWIPIKFGVQFLEGNPLRINNLSQIIISNEEEMSGILNWCIEGYKRLEENNKFSVCFSIEDIRNFWLENSDSVSCFYKRMIKIDYVEQEIKQEVYDNYVLFCEKVNKPVEEQNVFFRRLKNICDYKESTPSSKSNDRRRRLEGIKLIDINSLQGEVTI